LNEAPILGLSQEDFPVMHTVYEKRAASLEGQEGHA